MGCLLLIVALAIVIYFLIHVLAWSALQVAFAFSLAFIAMVALGAVFGGSK